ncbi:MAG: hypothetical protein B7733_21515 [Myxococcales bacterium FL481]|nr:MAG: hypothetical protein B7733_21515 [Myxococcales bacterium FL481]
MRHARIGRVSLVVAVAQPLGCIQSAWIHTGVDQESATGHGDVPPTGGPATTATATAADSEATSSTPPGDATGSESGSDESETGAETSATGDSDSSLATNTGAETATGDGEVESFERRVVVRLDGQPVTGVIVKQGGVEEHYLTGDDGTVTVTVQVNEGDLIVHASHPQARVGFAFVSPEDTEDAEIELVSFGAEDNEEYEFFPPGGPPEYLYCSHCHESIAEAWHESPHRTSASNVTVQDLYAGVATAVSDEAACQAAGGNWWQGLEPGSDALQGRCYLGAGTLPDLNDGCGDTGPCDQVAEAFGGCADCHAPAIDGKLGGRDLLEAQGVAYDSGVHCDLCHKTESLDLSAPPGVGGRLVVRRPTEWLGIEGEPWQPLSFGPFHDVSQVKMGAVYRPHFETAEFCAGCHQHDAAVEPGWGNIDTTRWPQGVLPLQSTYEEWAAGPMNPDAPCATCHMPPDGDVLNAADLQRFELVGPGMIAGWPRPFGQVNKHTWPGPRALDSGMLERAALLQLDKTVLDDSVVATVTVRNTGAGHAIPTGEPMRSMVVLVQTSCDAVPSPAVGGAAVPEFGGYLARKSAPEDWNVWAGATVGDVVRVLARPGEWYDYDGFGPFGDGTFTAEEKGMPVEAVVGQSTITAVDGDAVTFDQPLPAGDVAYRGEAVGALAELSGPAGAVAGAAGFAFARVLVAADGSTQVPHFRAVDVASDNRLAPQQSWSSTHVFQRDCDEPETRAVLLYRPYPLALARERRWPLENRVMAEVWQ